VEEGGAGQRTRRRSAPGWRTRGPRRALPAGARTCRCTHLRVRGDRLGIDLAQAVQRKVSITARRCPVERARAAATPPACP
jgi:hypothetical protein